MFVESYANYEFDLLWTYKLLLITPATVLVQSVSISFFLFLSLVCSPIWYLIKWCEISQLILEVFHWNSTDEFLDLVRRKEIWKKNEILHTSVGENWAISRSSLPCSIQMQIFYLANVYSTQLNDADDYDGDAASYFLFHNHIRWSPNSVLSAR